MYIDNKPFVFVSVALLICGLIIGIQWFGDPRIAADAERTRLEANQAAELFKVQLGLIEAQAQRDIEAVMLERVVNTYRAENTVEIETALTRFTVNLLETLPTTVTLLILGLTAVGLAWLWRLIQIQLPLPSPESYRILTMLPRNDQPRGLPSPDTLPVTVNARARSPVGPQEPEA